jgi:hypothetical protein
MRRRHALAALAATKALAASLALPHAHAHAPQGALLWHSRFAQGLADWGPTPRPWGADNQSFHNDAAIAGRLMRVRLLQGGIDPGTMARRGLPRSGTGFKARVLAEGAHSAQLSYRLRFAPGFDFVRGGKLPGLYGGLGHSGGAMPDGSDGFSLRLMWRERGGGEVYAYLPTSQVHGMSLLRGRLRFEPGRWHHIAQQVWLNRPGHDDGALRLWQDGVEVGVARDLRLRTTDALRIDGVFFDVFFGGNDDSWAARADTHIDFAEFELHDAPGPAPR